MSASGSRSIAVGGETQLAGIIGWPVAHSLSPAIHNAAFGMMDLDWVYVPLPVPPDAAVRAFDGLAQLGFRGVNVTMPHKTQAARACANRSPDAERLDAVNTIVVTDGDLHGHNTDVTGFDRFLRRDAGADPAGRSALVLGGGGAARAVALALAQGGVGALTVALRDTGGDASLRAALEGLPVPIRTVEFGEAAAASVDIVVNATPLGALGESVPAPPPRPGQLVVDLLYRPAITPLQARARAAGASVFGGLGLLLQQAALSFELWTGSPAPMSVMSAAALAMLAEPGESEAQPD